jgi:hypothetical protein
MRWTAGGLSTDIEDRRSEGGSGFRWMHLGLGGLIVLLLLSLVFKHDFISSFFGPSSAGPAVHQSLPRGHSRPG